VCSLILASLPQSHEIFYANPKHGPDSCRISRTCRAVRADERARGLEEALAGGGAAPQFCGVGVTASRSGDGYTVTALAEGMSGEQSGAVAVGDELLMVDGCDVNGCEPEVVRSMMHGLRGGEVRLTLCRGKRVFGLQLKRGSWGPEHAVVSDEVKDMSFTKSLTGQGSK
jgi:C-terminal processing protease CtpA/Prc